ncbi:hypothetical protein ISR94_03795 [Candidatus Microgenomates bacterium]|nr:hypothetical protein [Candidatus Microgenomates bacterium]
MQLKDLEKRISVIEQRNKRVETNKDWETSLTRRLILIIFTYLSIGFYMAAITVDKPWLNAIIPSLAFFLSTLTLPFIKTIWTKHIRK